VVCTCLELLQWFVLGLQTVDDCCLIKCGSLTLRDLKWFINCVALQNLMRLLYCQWCYNLQNKLLPCSLLSRWADIMNTRLNSYTHCTKHRWWLVLGWVTTKEYYPLIGLRFDLRTSTYGMSTYWYYNNIMCAEMYKLSTCHCLSWLHGHKTWMHPDIIFCYKW